MTLPASGAISMSQVRTELGATGAISLGQASVRALAGVASGAISLNVLHGKANAFNATITANQTDLNLRTWALANGWNGSSSAVITINSGVYIYSTSTANAGLTIDGSWAGGITLINNGYIMGKGADGPALASSVGNNGGHALSLGVSCTITNNSYIAGGGGSGANAGGGGAGGGNGGTLNTTVGAGGAGGGIGATGSNGTKAGSPDWGGGGGGGRILPGSGGAAVAGTTNARFAGLGGGAGGSGAAGSTGIGQCAQSIPRIGNNAGGGGGGWGAAGGSGQTGTSCGGTTYASGAGGSAGSAGANGTCPPQTTYAGGSGGNAVKLNGYSVTWNAVGTRYGAVA